jgi:two-component system sensor histidine kinase UhpB
MPVARPSSLPLGLLVRRWPERRRVVLAAAAVLFAAVMTARVAANDAPLGLSFLAVIPVVLVALESGRRAGLAAGMLVFAAVAAASLAGRPELDAVALATRGFVFLATGAAVGRFSDRMRAAHAREERLLRAGLRLTDAGGRDRLAEVAAREVMAMPGTVGASARIDGVLEVREGRQEGVRTSLPMDAHGLRVGVLEAVHVSPPGLEDRAALELLARQTAIAAENLRLLEIDGERAALESRLRDVRRELLASRSGTGLLLQAEEADRRRMAEKLHEDLAQILSAVLLGLRMIERSDGAGPHPSLVKLHEQVAGVLADVRDVARELRPVALDQLGLVAALEALAAAAQDRGARVTLRAEPVLPDMPDDVETAIFRFVQDAFAHEPGTGADVVLRGVEGGLEVTVAIGAASPETLLALRTRVESAGGAVTTSGSADGEAVLRATMPTRAR